MINVLKYRWLTAAFSFAIVSVFCAVFVYKYQKYGYAFSYSVDFTGGVQTLLKFDKSVSALAIREQLERAGFEGVSTREFGDNEILVRVKDFSNDAGGVAEKIRTTIQDSLPDTQVAMLSTDSVGPGVGKSLREKSVRAVAIALIALLAYIALRFWSLGFAVGAVVALFHDALMMLAVFLFFDREISINVIGAILAVLGYSINDTIVIFSQIRNNLKTMTNTSLSDVVNVSINQTMRRTLLTSISTGLTVGAMLILGGEVLRDFSLALLVGIIFGTYSSIYIASPVMMLLDRKRNA